MLYPARPEGIPVIYKVMKKHDPETSRIQMKYIIPSGAVDSTIRANPADPCPKILIAQDQRPAFLIDWSTG